MTQVVVIDYGMGNLHSVSKALEAVSVSETITVSSDLEVIKKIR
jgi:glutamine amidotransferase